MTPHLFKNWLQSIGHQYGSLKCAALACNLIHRSTLLNLGRIQPHYIVDIHRVIDIFEGFYEGRTLRQGVLQWLKTFEGQTDRLNYDFTPQTRTLSATNYLLKEMLGIPTNDEVPAWERSMLYAIDALNLPVPQFMMDAEFFLDHLD
jgi:hypothetical protein